MPGKVKVRVKSGRNLPVMDRSSDNTDAYVEVKIGNTTYKTDVFRKSLNPNWNSEWFIFEVDDLELQDEPLQIRLMDHDTYSANDAIGKVYIDLNPLLLSTPQQPTTSRNTCETAQANSAGGSVISGWLPVYDTMHGIRGEVNVIVKVDLFSDFNKFRQSSCGIQFFFTPEIPFGFRCQSILGFVEELVVDDDPEYQWIDKIRTPRASNEARQTLFSKLSGQLQRKIGLKVLELGGNAVIGYRQCFDLEGESGVVVRGIGSAVTLIRIVYDSAPITCGFGNPHSPSPLREFAAGSLPNNPRDLVDLSSKPSPSIISPTVLHASPRRRSRSRKISGCYSMSRSPQTVEGAETCKGDSGTGAWSGSNAAGSTQSPTHSGKMVSPSHTQGILINRRSSDSDISLAPKGGSLTGSGGSSGGKAVVMAANVTRGHKIIMTQESFDMLEYPFLSMRSFPPGFIVHLGGSVSARSVKLLDRAHAPEEIENRDSWWTQLRTEIRSHARAYACNVVLGYEEYTTICDEVCILSVAGTAAVISLQYHESDPLSGVPYRVPRDPCIPIEKKEPEPASQHYTTLPSKAISTSKEIQQSGVSRSHPTVLDDLSEGNSHPVMKTKHPSSSEVSLPSCAMCHIPYLDTSLPFKAKVFKCALCRKAKVPEVLFTTLDLPSTLPVTGRGCMIQARVCRPKRDLKGELNAKEVSDSLSFLEYELHTQLYYKLRVKGMNALFGLRVRVTLGEKSLIGIATATAVYLSALPPPFTPKVTNSAMNFTSKSKIAEIQKQLDDIIAKNREFYGICHKPDILQPESVERQISDTEDSEEDLPEVDLSSGNKDVCILELDDLEDAEIIQLLLDSSPPHRVICATTQNPPGIPRDRIVNNIQLFNNVWRSKIPINPSNTVFSSYFEKLMQTILFKIRKLSPCVVTGITFDVDLPEEDELQITVYGNILGLQSPNANPQAVTSALSQSSSQNMQTASAAEQKKHKVSDESEPVFRPDEEPPTEEPIPKGPSTTQAASSCPTQPLKGPLSSQSSNPLTHTTSSTHSFHSLSSFPSVPSANSFSSGTSSGRSSLKTKQEKQQFSLIEQPRPHLLGVQITPLSFIPGAKIERYLGNLNFFFIRESTSIKESGGLSGFVGCFINEVLAIVRAHVWALSGNAMISYFMSECAVAHSPHKNQGQCLINVGGDVVQLSYSSRGSHYSETSEQAQSPLAPSHPNAAADE